MNNAVHHLHVPTVGHTDNAKAEGLHSSSTSFTATDDTQFPDALLCVLLGHSVLLPEEATHAIDACKTADDTKHYHLAILHLPVRIDCFRSHSDPKPICVSTSFFIFDPS